MKLFSIFILYFFAFTSASAQWVQTKGPFIGKTTAMITVGNNIYACNRDWGGGADGRVYKSSNLGTDWVDADNGITPQFAFVSQFANIGETILAAANHLYRTNNQGGIWEVKEDGLFSQAISLMATNDTFWAGTSGGGVFRSTNLGESWMPMNNGLTGTVIVYDMAELNGYLFLATEGGGGSARLYRSSNRGLSWEFANTGLPLGTNPHHFAVNGNSLFVSVEGDFDQYEYGLYKSDDFGATWFPSNNGLPQVINGNTGEIFAHQGNLYVSTTFPGENTRVLKSTNNGASFSPASTGLRNSNEVLCYTAAGNYIFAGSGSYSAVFRTSNQGMSWEEARKGLANGEVYSLLDHNGRLYAGAQQGLYYTTDMGENWSEMLNGLPYGMPVHTIEKNNNTLYLGTEQYGVFRSTDNGNTWVERNTGLNGIYAEYINDLLYYNGALYAATWDGVYKSTNDGDTWTLSSTGLPGSTGSSGLVQTHSIIESNGVLFVGTTLEKIYKSTDNGATWVFSGNGLSTYASTVNVMLKVGNDLFAGTESGVYKSSDNGNNWTSTMLNGGPFKTLVHGNNELYASQHGPTVLTGYGVLRSRDTGVTWETINDGMFPDARLLSLLVYNNVLFAGTDTRSVWKRTAAAAPVPVVFTQFIGRNVSGGNELIWTTGMENNNRGFEIQRSMDGVNFDAITFISSLAPGGNSNQSITYTYTDAEAEQRDAWYRLRQVNLDGGSTMSSSILIKVSTEFAIQNMYPNPVVSTLQLDIYSPDGADIHYHVSDMNGKIVQKKSVVGVEGQNFIQVPMSTLTAGIYNISIQHKAGKKVRKQFVKIN